MARLLVVDDHFLFAQSVGDLLASRPGYEVVGVGVSGAQALALAGTERPDVILLDYHLPGYSADTLIPRLLEASPASRIVVLTSDTRDTTLAAALRAGAAACLTKDRAYEEVLDVIEGLAPREERAPVARAVARAARPPAAEAAATAPAAATAAAAPGAGPARHPAWPETRADPTSAPTTPVPPGWCEIRAAGIGSLGRAYRLERALESLPVVAGVHLRDLAGGAAVLRLAMRAGRTVDELVAALAADADTPVRRQGTQHLELGPA